MAICKKALGTNKSKANYYDIFKKWIPSGNVDENISGCHAKITIPIKKGE